MAFTAILGSADAQLGNIVLAFNGQGAPAFLPPAHWQPNTSQPVRVRGLRGWTQAQSFEPPWDPTLDPVLTLFVGWDTCTQPWLRGAHRRRHQHDPSGFLPELYFNPIGSPPVVLLRQLQTGHKSWSYHV